MRTKFLDYNARHDPKTDHFCIRCQKDLYVGKRGAAKPSSQFRVVELVNVNDAPHIVHPEDETEVVKDRNYLGIYPVGMECVKIIGEEWCYYSLISPAQIIEKRKRALASIAAPSTPEEAT